MNKVTVEYSITLPDGQKSSHSATLNLPEGFKVEQLGQDPVKFVRNTFLLTCLSVAKGIAYGDSWRGGKGASPFKAENMCVLGNIMRKYDRVMNSAERSIVDGRIDGNGDLAVYSMLYLQLLEEFYPKAYKDWIETDVIAYINKAATPDRPII